MEAKKQENQKYDGIFVGLHFIGVLQIGVPE
jgi:hypothetical protein